MPQNKTLSFTVLAFLAFCSILGTPLSAFAQVAGESPVFPYTKKFTISAYYSPLPNQKKYVTGSYASDIRLNGGGVHGADGTPVFPGMIAAPKSYPFGTKMKIPGLGTVAVHDRGGAIVQAGQRNESYDRLDVWMGYGDAGLHRALNWGKRTLEVTVYGIDPSIEESISLNGYTPEEKYSVGVVEEVEEQPLPVSSMFPEDLSFGDEGAAVARLQTSLKKMNSYPGEITSKFDGATQDALIRFQIETGIIDDGLDFGAGYFGPRTRKALEKCENGEMVLVSKVTSTPEEQVLANRLATISFQSKADTLTFASVFDRDLKIGDKGEQVKALQEELRKVNYLAVDPTGYFGEVTRHALLKFQQSQGIVKTESDPGAGVLGPNTRNRLNLLISARDQTQKMIALKQQEEAKVRLALQ